MGNAVPKIVSLESDARTSGRVLLVSNRLPVTAVGDSGRARASSGGLVTGLRQVAHRWPAVWIGWDGVGRSRDDVELEVERPFGDGCTVALSLSEEEVAGFYRRYCNGLLWPVLHGRIADLPADEKDWRTYVAMNERFADAVIRRARPGDRVWVHDYHLFLLPMLLRKKRPDLPIAFFLHTAFPEPEVFRAIPQGRDLLRGILAADRIGFHTEAYAANFLRTAAAMGYRVQGAGVANGGRIIQVAVHPMGIDHDAFAALARRPEVLEDVADIRRQYGRVLLGVDRLDYTKGIPQRLLAFEMLLERYPRLQGNITFFQVAVPSREEVPAYQDLRRVVEMLVERINARFGRGDWLPVQYLYGSVDLGSLVALYRAAEVMVVTPVRDGLNLVAKEFVASRTDLDGVLVLSRFAGAAEELDAALQVDPNRTAALAETFRTALTMPGRQRRRRMRMLRRSVAGNSVFDWATAILASLESLGSRRPVGARPEPHGMGHPGRETGREQKSPSAPAVTAWAALPSLASS